MTTDSRWYRLHFDDHAEPSEIASCILSNSGKQVFSNFGYHLANTLFTARSRQICVLAALDEDEEINKTLLVVSHIANHYICKNSKKSLDCIYIACSQNNG